MRETAPSTPAPTEPAPRDLAVLAERADTLNWLDQHAAAPAHVSAALGLAAQHQDGLAMVRSHIPFSHFNMVLTLGCPAVVDEAAWKAIDCFFAVGGGRHWVLVNDHSRPPDLAARLQSRGYQPDGAWDRVVLRGARPDLWLAHAQGCEIVSGSNVNDWTDFIRRCYGMPPVVADWLRALVGRHGWIHALRREAGREGGREGGPVVMVRSAFVTDDGWCWLGIDAPVPGVMAPCFDDDQKVSATLLMAAAQAGARCFVTDIEAPSPDRAGPGYRCWGDLGLQPVYLRSLFRSGP